MDGLWTDSDSPMPWIKLALAILTFVGVVGACSAISGRLEDGTFVDYPAKSQTCVVQDMRITTCFDASND